MVPNGLAGWDQPGTWNNGYSSDVHEGDLFVLCVGEPFPCDNKCDVNADCINNQCECNVGYSGDGLTCAATTTSTTTNTPAAEITLENIKYAEGPIRGHKAAKEACAAIKGKNGSYQLPVPKTEAENEVLRSWPFPEVYPGHKCVPLGISDSVTEGEWINFYTG